METIEAKTNTREKYADTFVNCASLRGRLADEIEKQVFFFCPVFCSLYTYRAHNKYNIYSEI